MSINITDLVKTQSNNNTIMSEKLPKVYEAGRLNPMDSVKKEVSGETIRVDDVSNVEHNVECSVSSKNLLDTTGIMGTSITAYGGTLTCGEDGGITGNGTPTNAIAFSTNNGLDKHFLPSATYVLSSSGEYTNITCSVYLRNSSGSSIVSLGVSESGKSTVINCADYPEYNYMTFEIKRGKNDIEMSGTAYFQLEAGSTATAYTPYVSDFSSVKVSRYGKNLFEYKLGDLGTGEFIEYLSNGAVMKGNYSEGANNNAYNNGWFNLTKSKVDVKAGDVMTISCDYTLLELDEHRTIDEFTKGNNTKKVGLYLKNSTEGLYKYPITQPKTLGETIRMYCTYTITTDNTYWPTITLNSNKVRIENIQIEVGSDSTDFEEYKGKQIMVANADGTVEGLTSVSPTMTLLTDTSGVNINCEYYTHINIFGEQKYQEGYEQGNDDGYEVGYDKGYAEGIEQGGGDVPSQDPDKIIEKTVSEKKSVSIDDVSEVPHKIKVQLSSDTITDFSGITISQPNGVDLFTGDLELGSFSTSTGAGSDSTTRVRSTDYIPVSQGVYTLSTDDGKDSVVYVYDEQRNYLKDESYVSWTLTNRFTFNIQGSRLIRFGIRKNTSNDTITLNDVKIVKLEKHTQVVSNSDGTVEGLFSVSPDMTLTSDTENVNITVTYHKSYGMQLEYDRFWDALQANGDRTYYANAFMGQDGMPAFWNETNFKPKYDIVPCSSKSATDCLFMYSQITDLAKLFEKSSGKLDFSKSPKLNSCFYQTTITKIPPMDLSSCTEMYRVFYSSQKITDITINNLREDCTFSGVFYYNKALVNLAITGTIGKDGFDLTQSTKLTKNSLINIINVLSDTTTGLSVTLSQTAVKKAFETSSGANDGNTSEEWSKLIATKTNWTINLK